MNYDPHPHSRNNAPRSRQVPSFEAARSEPAAGRRIGSSKWWVLSLVRILSESLRSQRVRPVRGAWALTREEDVDAHALRRQGWSISEIARHHGRDRKAVRAYLNGERVPEHRRRAPDPLAPFVDYCRQRLADDPHLWTSTLLDEITELGYQGTYSTFTRALRRHQLRPHCEPCKAATGRDVAAVPRRLASILEATADPVRVLPTGCCGCCRGLAGTSGLGASRVSQRGQLAVRPRGPGPGVEPLLGRPNGLPRPVRSEERPTPPTGRGSAPRLPTT